MRKRISAVIVILGICSVLLYVKSAGGRYPAEEMEVQEDISEKEQEPEEMEVPEDISEKEQEPEEIAAVEEVEKTEEETAVNVDEQPEEEKIYPDEWEMEYVEAIRMPYRYRVTQEDIDRIGQYRNLKRLEIYISDEELDLSPLSNLTELEAIDLGAYSENGIDVSFLADLTKLKELSFFEVNLKDYSFLYSLHQLREIYIENNSAIKDLSFFSDMPYLKSLDISNVEDADLSCLENLEKIERVDIEGYHIRNAESLANLSHIKRLSLFEYDEDEDKRLTLDLHILDGMTELEGFSLYFIDIEDVSPLADKQFLKHITLVDTGIDDIEPLAKLDTLQWLAVWGNDSEKVQEQSELYFKDVDEVEISDGIPCEVWEL